MGPGQAPSPFWRARGISPSFPYKTYFQLENLPPENCTLRAEKFLQPLKGLWRFNLLSLKMKLHLKMPWPTNPDPGIVCPRAELLCAQLKETPSHHGLLCRALFSSDRLHEYLRAKVPLAEELIIWGSWPSFCAWQPFSCLAPSHRGFVHGQEHCGHIIVQTWCLWSFRAHKGWTPPERGFQDGNFTFRSLNST